jgi:hypothetical protein
VGGGGIFPTFGRYLLYKKKIISIMGLAHTRTLVEVFLKK